MGEHDGNLLDRWESTGDQDAFMELVVRYQGMVYGTCLRIVKDPGRRVSRENETNRLKLF